MWSVCPCVPCMRCSLNWIWGKISFCPGRFCSSTQPCHPERSEGSENTDLRQAVRRMVEEGAVRFFVMSFLGMPKREQLRNT